MNFNILYIFIVFAYIYVHSIYIYIIHIYIYIFEYYIHMFHFFYLHFIFTHNLYIHNIFVSFLFIHTCMHTYIYIARTHIFTYIYICTHTYYIYIHSAWKNDASDQGGIIPAKPNPPNDTVVDKMTRLWSDFTPLLGDFTFFWRC
jgi:hypothetical protein